MKIMTRLHINIVVLLVFSLCSLAATVGWAKESPQTTEAQASELTLQGISKG